jgi:hypothetical protein
MFPTNSSHPGVHHSNFPPSLSIAFRLGTVGLCLLALGCMMSPPLIVKLDHHFSMNVGKPPTGFPDKRLKLSAAESEVLARRGNPDFIRIWWRSDGSLITSSDLSGHHDEMNPMLNASKKSWIYLNTGDKENSGKDNGEEVIFVGSGYKVRPLDQKLKLVCTYGDPDDRSAPTMRDGATFETWRWIEYGIQIELMDGKEVSRTNFNASGSGTYLGK